MERKADAVFFRTKVLRSPSPVPPLTLRPWSIVRKPKTCRELYRHLVHERGPGDVGHLGSAIQLSSKLLTRAPFSGDALNGGIARARGFTEMLRRSSRHRFENSVVTTRTPASGQCRTIPNKGAAQHQPYTDIGVSNARGTLATGILGFHTIN